MSSPRINYVIALGCVLIYVDVILWGIDSLNDGSQQVLCTVCVNYYVQAKCKSININQLKVKISKECIIGMCITYIFMNISR